MAAPSPNWKKPADTMLLRRSKKKAVTTLKRRHLPLTSHDSPGTLGSPASQPQKRRNPFSCPERKRHVNLTSSNGLSNVATSDGFTDEAPECVPTALFDVLDAAAQDGSRRGNVESRLTKPRIGSDRVPENISCGEISPTVEQIPTAVTPQKEEDKPIEWTDWFPVDWSLKRKLRFVSDKSFSWCCPLRTAEEAAGVSSFVRCQSTNLAGEQSQEMSDRSNAQAELHKCCMVWSHPHLPWFNLFPRIVPDNRIGKVCPALQMEDIQNALLADWAESFTSAFRLVRARHCPYFYMCTHQMTVLFRAAGVAGLQHTHSIVTPTSRGFREALVKEGITFSMPLNDRKKAEDERRSENDDSVTTEVTDDTQDTADADRIQDDDDDEEDILQSLDGAHTWLEDLGLDKSQFRSLDPNKVKLERETFRTIDRRPESLVLVEGADTLALFNYLLNCHSCVAATGVQAGLPPTLLAPVAFKGATLETLKVKQCTVRQQQSSGTMQQGYSLEVTGPLLPHSVDGLNRLLTLSHSYTCVYSTHEPTVPFNSVGKRDEDSDKQADPKQDLKHSGIASEHMSNITSCMTSLGNRALREFVCDDRGLYHWTL